MSRKVLVHYIYGGQEYSFAEAVPAEFICPICHHILQEPLQTTCGHFFCKECLATIAHDLKRKQGYASGKAQLEDQLPPCPTCCNASPGAGVPDKHTERKISNLQVNCDNNSCNWVGALGLVAEHKSEEGMEGVCHFEFLDCTLKCGERMIRKKLKNHIQNDCSLREVTCQFCKSKMQHGKQRQHHKSCLEYPMTCQNQCGEVSIPARGYEDHIEASLEERVECSFIQVGCTAKFESRSAEEHHASNVSQHRALLIKMLNNVSDHLTLLNIMEKFNTPHPGEVSVSAFSPWLKNIKRVDTPPWIVCSDLINPYNDIWPSSPFRSSPNGYKLQLKITGMVATLPKIIYGKIVILDDDIRFATPEPLPDFKVTLLNQKMNKDHVTKTVPCVCDSELEGKPIRSQGMWTDIEYPYLVDSCMYFRVEKL